MFWKKQPVSAAITETPLPTHRTKLCFLIAASPNDGFYSQIAMYRKALNHLGGIYEEAPIVAIFGDAKPISLPKRWEPHFRNVFIRRVSPEDFDKKRYMAQIDARWLNVPDCEYAIFTDADVMILKPIDDVLEQLASAPRIAGVIAYRTFPQFTEDSPQKKWNTIATQLIGKPLTFEHVHTIIDDFPESERACPFYLNFGFVVVPRDILEEIQPSYLSLRPQVERHLKDPYFAAQVALTLAVYKHDVPRLELPIKFNFMNSTSLENKHPKDLDDLRVFHFARVTNRKRLDRQKIFSSKWAFNRFLGLKLDKSEKLFQDHVRVLTNSRYPF